MRKVANRQRDKLNNDKNNLLGGSNYLAVTVRKFTGFVSYQSKLEPRAAKTHIHFRITWDKPFFLDRV